MEVQAPPDLRYASADRRFVTKYIMALKVHELLCYKSAIGGSRSEISGLKPASFRHGANSGSSAIPGRAATTLNRKNSGQPVCSTIDPAGAARKFRPTASTPESSAYCVAENFGLPRV